MGRIYNDNPLSIGNTPLLRLKRVTQGARAGERARIEGVRLASALGGKATVVVFRDLAERHPSTPLFEGVGE